MISKQCESDPLISNEYPSGNPFDDVVDVMIYGAIIIRFKYVSRDQSSPQEKLVSYHLMDFKDKKVLVYIYKVIINLVCTSNGDKATKDLCLFTQTTITR